MNHDLQVGPLRTLATIVDLGGFGRAAEALHITQPAVSQQIRRLESLLKQPVFTATGRHMRLSPAGEELLGYARKIIALNDEAVARFTPRSGSPRLALGISDQFTDVLPEFLRILKRQATSAQITIRTGVSEALVEHLSSGVVDIVLMLGGPAAVPGYRVTELGRIAMGWFGRPAKASDAALPLVMFTEPCTLRGQIVNAFEEPGIPWRIGYEGSELIGVRAAIQAGLGVGCLIANAGELWDLPTAVSPGLPPPPVAPPLTLAVSELVPDDLAGTAADGLRQALAGYPIHAPTG